MGQVSEGWKRGGSEKEVGDLKRWEREGGRRGKEGGKKGELEDRMGPCSELNLNPRP